MFKLNTVRLDQGTTVKLEEGEPHLQTGNRANILNGNIKMTNENSTVITLPNENLSVEEFTANLIRVLASDQLLKASISVTALMDYGETKHLQIDLDNESGRTMNQSVSVGGTAATSVYRSITEATKLSTVCSEFDQAVVLIGGREIVILTDK